MTEKPLNTRFAPSPTGYIHIGNVRSAIYPYLLAKQTGGKFILRIEDTDQARFVDGATELIEDTLKWLGLDWDEGPIVGGPSEPYFQSERAEIYQKYALKLLESGRAYFDPTPPEKVAEYRKIAASRREPYLYRNFRPEITPSAPKSTSSSEFLGPASPPAAAGGGAPGIALRAADDPKEFDPNTSTNKLPEFSSEGVAPRKGLPQKIDGFEGDFLREKRGDRTPSKKIPKKNIIWQEGVPIRFKSDPKPREWHDEVMGDMHAGPEVQDDIILIKKDGLPTYNFAHIVDDYEMGVDIIMRGVEYLSSMPNYLAIYEALGIKPPKFASLPHILAPTGNKKLGKRDGAKSVTEYRDDGILPEAMLNYLACLGWNDGSEQEIYTKDELIKKFSLDRIQSSGARYDETKLLWMNGQWLRELVAEQGIDAVFERTAGFWPDNAEKWVQDNSANSTEAPGFGSDFSKDVRSAQHEVSAAPPAAAGGADAVREKSGAKTSSSPLENYEKQVFSIIYDRLKTLSDLRTMTPYFFEDPEVDLEMLKSNKFVKKMSPEAQKRALDASIVKLGSLGSWEPEPLQSALNELLEELGEKPAQLFSLLRIAISFAPFTPALNLTMSVLGRETTLRRLKAANSVLGEPDEKQND